MYRQALVASAVQKLLIKSAAAGTSTDQEHPPQRIAMNRVVAGIGAGTLGLGTGGIAYNRITNYLRRSPERAEKALDEWVQRVAPPFGILKTRYAKQRIMDIVNSANNREQMVKQIQELFHEAKSNPQLAESLNSLPPSFLKWLTNIEDENRFKQRMQAMFNYAEKMHNRWLELRGLAEDHFRKRLRYRLATKVFPRMARPLGLLAGIPVGLGTGGLAWHLATRNVPPLADVQSV